MTGEQVPPFSHGDELHKFWYSHRSPVHSSGHVHMKPVDE
jgi:hypothetical protein